MALIPGFLCYKGAPFLVQKLLEVKIGEGSRGVCPGALESGAIRVAPAKAVRATESNDLLVIESHAVEDMTQMF